MRYFKKDGTVYAFSDEQLEQGYGADMEPMTPEELGAHLNPPKPKEQVQAEYTAFLQGMLDSKAREYGYDSISTAVTYADEPIVSKFQEEGKAFRSWRSEFWDKGYAIIAQVEAGERELPTEQELIDEMPSFSIPYPPLVEPEVPVA